MWVGNGSGSFPTVVNLVLALWSRAADGAELCQGAWQFIVHTHRLCISPLVSFFS